MNMNTLRVASVLALGVIACLLGGTAAAHGHVRSHVGVGIVVDPFWFGSWPYPGPYYYPPYYYPPVVAAPPPPPVYIERGGAPEAYWYYCEKPSGYYPYVKHCPGGWQPVAPQPDEE